jgi:regulator of sirC expression with transglutaminase-like and TPR domain
VSPDRSFARVAGEPEPALDRLALALAAEFRAVDADAALAELDRLGAELASARCGDADAEADACRRVLAEGWGFAGETEEYDDPANSMLDLVLERRRGLPILLSVVYVEAARRAGIPLGGIGLPGHFVVGHFGRTPPVVLDPFEGGARIEPDVPARILRAWHPHAIALRMLNNLVGAYNVRGDLDRALHAAKLRLVLPLDEPLRRQMDVELRSLRARLN